MHRPPTLGPDSLRSTFERDNANGVSQRISSTAPSPLIVLPRILNDVAHPHRCKPELRHTVTPRKPRNNLRRERRTTMSEPHPAETILKLSTAYWASRCLHAVAQFGIADALGDEPQPAAALAKKTGTNADA